MGYTSIAGMPVVTGLYKMLVPKRCSRWSLASLAALVTAGLLLLARLIGLAFLADFLSRAVLIGFLTGVGIQVAAAQLAGMLGVPGGGTGTIDKVLTALLHIRQTNIPPLIVAVAVTP